MKRLLLFCRVVPITLVVVVLFAVTSQVDAGVDYADPPEGWTYLFDGDAADPDPGAALDGTWDHDNASDEWDGSSIGEDAPGGVSALVEEGTGVTYIRIQDSGDPRDYPDEDFIPDDPSNRKVFLDRDIIGLDDLSETFLDDGFTFSFRARLATTATGPLDPWYPNGGGGPDDWAEEGFGYAIHDNATANFSFYQPNGVGALGFSLATPRDDRFIDGTGLLMNDTIADFPDEDAGETGNGDVNLLEIENLTEWHEFWINIIAVEGGDGTHIISIYMDGSTTPDVYEVTAGTRADGGANLTQGPMSMGMGATPLEGALDLDFIAYIPGVIEPSPGGLTGDYNSNGELDAGDLDLQAIEIVAIPGDLAFDLNGDKVVNYADRQVWVADLKGTWIGDANLDLQFNSGDMVQVFVQGKYEKDEIAGWAEGDWNGDTRFDSGDMVAAFVDGGYEKGEKDGGPNAVNAVPEPGGWLLLILGLAGLLTTRRRG